jgi:putative DNA primase/helicase
MFWTHNALAYEYTEDAATPIQWHKFLKQIWPDDPESIRALQEMFGYLLTGDTSQQKAFMLVGPKRSGKGTIARVLTALLGQSNVCQPTLASLSSQFGLAPLINKLVAIIADARVGARSDQHQIAERLLSVSGEDGQTVDRKFLQPWSGQLSTRFVLMTNELPRFAGEDLLRTPWATILDQSPVELLDLALRAKQLGLINASSGGGVVEIDVTPLESTQGLL